MEMIQLLVSGKCSVGGNEQPAEEKCSNEKRSRSRISKAHLSTVPLLLPDTAARVGMPLWRDEYMDGWTAGWLAGWIDGWTMVGHTDGEIIA